MVCAMNMIDEGIKVLKKIESLGYEAYIIGGATRDYLLGNEINDVDITTNMPLNELKNHFKIIDNGIEYQSVTIDILAGFEITHFRRDISYINHRHPVVEEVESLREDVLRRDFTINALAMDSNKNIIDYFNGISDLNNKIIKAINNPYDRFEEDALRILRALHFSAKLGFEIEDNTLSAMIDKKHLLKFLSHQRLYDYLIKIAYSKTNKGIDYINKYDLFSEILEYKNYLSIINKNYSINDLAIYYYLQFNEFPSLIDNDLKNNATLLKELINNNFDNYSLYKYQNIIKNNISIINNLGYNSNDILYRLDNLKIKSNNELALSQKDISMIYSGKMISIAIKEIIKAILEERISNNKEEILTYLQGLDVVKC